MSTNTDTDTKSQQAIDSYDEFDAREHCQPSSEKVAKRAEWEAFDFRVLDSGNVEVVNRSHGDEESDEHVYHVVMDAEGVPKWCLRKKGDGDWEDCPARKWHCDHDADPHEVCKHGWAVARNDAIVSAVRAVKRAN